MFLGCIRSGAILLSTNGLALFGICCYIANFSELPPIITEIRCYHSALDIGPCVYFTKTISKPESNFWPCKVSTKACAYEPIWIFLNSVWFVGVWDPRPQSIPLIPLAFGSRKMYFPSFRQFLNYSQCHYCSFELYMCKYFGCKTYFRSVRHQYFENCD